jgi:hypothetical protein
MKVFLFTTQQLKSVGSWSAIGQMGSKERSSPWFLFQHSLLYMSIVEHLFPMVIERMREIEKRLCVG